MAWRHDMTMTELAIVLKKYWPITLTVIFALYMYGTDGDKGENTDAGEGKK